LARDRLGIKLAESGQSGLETFSVGFDDLGDREGNEFRYSDLIAEVFATEHPASMCPPSSCCRRSTTRSQR